MVSVVVVVVVMESVLVLVTDYLVLQFGLGGCGSGRYGSGRCGIGRVHSSWRTLHYGPVFTLQCSMSKTHTNTLNSRRPEMAQSCKERNMKVYFNYEVYKRKCML